MVLKPQQHVIRMTCCGAAAAAACPPAPLGQHALATTQSLAVAAGKEFSLATSLIGVCQSELTETVISLDVDLVDPAGFSVAEDALALTTLES